MRKIQFRGKSLNNGKWAYGDLFHIDGKTAICPTDDINWMDGSELESSKWCWVDPDTVGQFTGLCDKNGKEIYEGDTIHLNDEEFELEHGNGIVVFLDKDCGGRPCGGMWYVEDADEDSNTNTSLYDLYQCGELEVIGNIHDNPELLK